MRYKLEEIAEFQKGFAFKSKDFKDSGVRIVKVSNLTSESIDSSSCVCIDNDLAEKYIQYELIKDDIIITTVGSWPTNPASVVGKVVKVPENMNNSLLNQNAVRIRGNSLVNQRYLYYLLKSNNFRDYIIGTAQGSANQASITQKDIKNFKYDIPTLKEQEAISKILSDLDEKIETNIEINKKLEEMAQAIFKQWFVDFEFPNEEGKPYKSSGGEMIESELGMIPKGWGVDSLSNLVKEVITGKTPSTKKSENYGDKYPFVTIPDMHNKVFVTKTERYLSEDGHKLQEKKLIPKNSIMVSCIATVGLVSISSEAVHTNQQINSIIPNSIEEVFYFYEYLKLMEDRLKGIGSAGSATLNVNKGEFEKIKYIYPDSRIINKYNNTVKNIYEKIKLNEIENNRLVQLRDILLPKLMSGEIRVPLV